MIVTGQHSFPFSSVNDRENGTKLFSEVSDGLSFAQLLEKSGTQYEIALDSEENRHVEILSESVLNESNGYQVVVGENGNPVTEIRETAEYASQAVADAGAPDYESVNGLTETDSSGKAENDRQTDDKPFLNNAVAAETRETRSEKTAVDGHLQVSDSKQIQKKNDALKNALNEKAGVEKITTANAKAVAEESVKTASVAGNIGRKKQPVVSENAAEKEGVRMAVRETGGPATTRLERVVTVSVLRTEEVKKESGTAAGAKERKSLGTAVGVEEKSVFAEKNAATDSVSNLFSQTAKDPAVFEKTVQGITKADLVRELKEQGSSEILREAKILVKDGQSGEIKLILRPQELGTVKINLILENKHIVGKIFVDNNIVKDALQTAFGDLKEVFAEQGMELGALDVFVSQESKRDDVFSGEEEIDVIPLKMARAVGAVEKHAEIVRFRADGSGIDIEV